MKQTLRTHHAAWINARFLERPITGVERVGREMLGALAQQLDDNGRITLEGGQSVQFTLLAPNNSSATSPWPNLVLHKRGNGSGHLWEQFALPRITAGDYLISLCNTGPICKRKHLLFLHDAQAFAIPENFNWKFRIWYRTLFSIAGRTAQHILTNSSFSRDELVRHIGLNYNKIHPIWLGSEHALATEPNTDLLTQHQLQKGSYIFAVASLNPNKNFISVLKALEQLGDSAPPCVIAGQRYDKVFDSGVRLDPKKTLHVGYVSDAQLYALYQNAMCLVFPSFYEGFGLPPVEAMRLGCPAIVSKTSVMPEVCADAALYCDPSDPSSLARAITQMQHTPNLRADLIEKGKQRARIFSWRSAAHHLLRILNQDLEPSPEHAALRHPDSAVGMHGTAQRTYSTTKELTP